MPAEPAPRPVRVRIRLSPEQRRAFHSFAEAMGWPAADAAKILLAYPAAIAEGADLSPAETREALGAARAELATLRHRAFMADETIRTLEMNIAGCTAAIAQFDRSLPLLAARRDALQARWERLAAEAGARGVAVPEEPDDPGDPGTAAQRVLGSFRRHSRGAGGPEGGGATAP
jgi:septal ring factor EnvC (AmiA/AmiB activator)